MVIPLLSPPPETHSKRGNMALHPRCNVFSKALSLSLSTFPMSIQ